MPSGLKVVKQLPPPDVLNGRIRKQYKKNITPLVKKHALLRQALVMAWQAEHRPKFKGTVTIGRETVSADIIIINDKQRINDYSPATVADLWQWWEHTGTKPHVIQPVRAEILRFTVGTEIVYAMLVNHRGTKPKRKTPPWNKELTRDIGNLINVSIKEGLK